jgi:hypothetical protein
MQEYRIYLIDPAGRITQPAEVIECTDDEAAIAQAKQYINGRAVEVWRGAQRIVHFDPISTTPGSF